MLYLLSYNSEVTTHALGVLSSYIPHHTYPDILQVHSHKCAPPNSMRQYIHIYIVRFDVYRIHFTVPSDYFLCPMLPHRLAMAT